MTEWFARPVLHVSSVEASLRFYVDQLGCTMPWQYEEEGRVRVGQVDRTGVKVRITTCRIHGPSLVTSSC